MTPVKKKDEKGSVGVGRNNKVTQYKNTIPQKKKKMKQYTSLFFFLQLFVIADVVH